MTSMRTRAAACLVVLATACTGTGAVSTTDARETAALAKKIQANPADAEAILKEAGTDPASFEAKLYDIARDPEASRAYAEVLGK